MSDRGPEYSLWPPAVINSAELIPIMFGFLLQWPTLLTVAMFPILVWMYVCLARQEEGKALTAFGEADAR